MANTPEQQQRNVENLQTNPSVEDVLVDSQREQDFLSMEQRIKAESNSLASSVNQNNETETLEISSEQQQLIEDVDDLLVKYQGLTKWIRSAEWSWATKRHLRHRLNENIESLKRMKKDLKHNYDDLATYRARVSELTYYFGHYEQVRQIVVLWWRTSDIHAIIDSKQDARYARKQENKDARYQSSMNDILHEAALTSLWNDDMERYEEYLEAVLNGQVEPSSHPFYTAHKQSFAMIQATSPNLYWALAPSRRWQVRYDTYCQQNWIPCNNGRFNPNRRYRTWTIWDDIASMIEDSQRRRWKEVNPQQREALRRVWNVCSVAWCIALGIGILREIFPWKAEREKRKKWESRLNRWKVLGLWAGIYWIRHYTEIKDTVLDVFNWDPDNWVARRQSEREQRRATEQAQTQVQANTWLSSSETTEIVNAKITYPILVCSTVWSIPIKQLIEQKIVEEKNWKLVLNKANYAAYVETMALALWRSEKDKKAMLDRVASNEAVESISNWLAYCWINTLNDLNNLKWSSDTSTLMDSATFKAKYKLQIEAITKQTWIFSNMAKQWFIPVWLDETIKILENYDSNKNENEQILERLKAWLLKPSSDKKYKIEDMINNPDVNLEKMTMKWFTSGVNEIKFSTYWELFDTVHITNWIKEHFKWRTDAKDAAPFHINLRWQIEFNNTEWYEIYKNEPTVIWLKELRKHLPTVNKNKQAYVDYLNKRRKWSQNEIIEENKINLAWYPILKEMGINFVDENEAKIAEARLKEVKDQLKNYIPWVSGYKPFFITGNKLWFTTISWTKIYFPDIFADEFEWKSRNLSNFPSILRNKQKFLDYMNNPSNNMRWEQIRLGA